jgi:hypothetical protein
MQACCTKGWRTIQAARSSNRGTVAERRRYHLGGIVALVSVYDVTYQLFSVNDKQDHCSDVFSNVPHLAPPELDTTPPAWAQIMCAGNAVRNEARRLSQHAMYSYSAQWDGTPLVLLDTFGRLRCQYLAVLELSLDGTIKLYPPFSELNVSANSSLLCTLAGCSIVVRLFAPRPYSHAPWRAPQIQEVRRGTGRPLSKGADASYFSCVDSLARYLRCSLL